MAAGHGVELAAAVVGDDDARRRRARPPAGRRPGAHALEHDRQVGDPAQPVEVLPARAGSKAMDGRGRSPGPAGSRSAGPAAGPEAVAQVALARCPNTGESTVTTSARHPAASARRTRCAGEPAVRLDVELEPQAGPAVVARRRSPRRRPWRPCSTIITAPAAAAARAVASSPSGWARRWNAVGATTTGIGTPGAEQRRRPAPGGRRRAARGARRPSRPKRRLVLAHGDLVVGAAGEEVVHRRVQPPRGPGPRGRGRVTAAAGVTGLRAGRRPSAPVQLAGEERRQRARGAPAGRSTRSPGSR